MARTVFNMRHYRFPAGQLVVRRDTRTCCFIPHWCPFIQQQMTRQQAAEALRTLRRHQPDTA